MSCFLPNGLKRPILDVNSDFLVYLWNFPNYLSMGDIRKEIFRRCGFVRFIETFEAWNNKKIGQIILEFVKREEMDAFIEAFERKEILNKFDPPIEFLSLQKVGRKEFFEYVKEWSGVDLISCGGIPPSFNNKSNKNLISSFSSSRPLNNKIYKHIDEQEEQQPQKRSSIFTRVNIGKENDEKVDQRPISFGGGKSGLFGKKFQEEENEFFDKANDDKVEQRPFFRGAGRGRSSSFGRKSPTGDNFQGAGRGRSGSFGRKSPTAGDNFQGEKGMKSASFGRKSPVEEENKTNKFNDRQFGNNNVRGGFGSRRESLMEKLNKPFAAEWANCALPPRLNSKQRRTLEWKNKLFQENAETCQSSPSVDAPLVKESLSSFPPSTALNENNNNAEENNKKEEKEEEPLICPTTNSTSFKESFNNYRNKPPSLASEDDDTHNIMLIQKIKLGFSIEKILEDLQNFGDIIEFKQLDETTAMFKFLDASEAELAAKVVSKNFNLFGTTAIFKLLKFKNTNLKLHNKKKKRNVKKLTKKILILNPNMKNKNYNH
ncbi:hypothetical protein Mgra_00000649 [Meloidogyne graminicola]|uniref:RRM domain-containing protein n=1 Tax=Meloidogyne graminicola TaxID=189291 RepID=A0A8T0A2X0_9BILA|nr:hypothetical protein Mgra_00000649 [Meloidogyne graminicola]